MEALGFRLSRAVSVASCGIISEFNSGISVAKIIPFRFRIVVEFSTDVFGVDFGKGKAQGLPIWVGIFIGSNSFNATPISLRCNSVICGFEGEE